VKNLLDLRFGEININELVISNRGRVLFAERAFHGLEPPICLMEKEWTIANLKEPESNFLLIKMFRKIRGFAINTFA
jgi:hypothetical protein